MANNLKGYDANQVLRSVFDVDKNTLRVSIIDGSSGGGSFEVVISHLNDSIRLGDGTNFITSTTIGPKTGLDVSVVNEIDISDLDASKDNVAIRDADGDELAINPDGSINVSTTPSGTVGNRFNEVSSVAAGVLTTVLSFTATSFGHLTQVSASGDNKAEYYIYVNGVLMDKRRSYYTDYNVMFDLGRGIPYGVNNIIQIRVLHNATTTGTFSARAQTVE